MSAMPIVVEVAVVGGHRLHLRFNDGAEGHVDVDAVVGDFTGVFAPLADEAEFRNVRVDPESGTLVWPSGADIDPLVLYEAATGRAVTQGWSAAESPTTYGDR